MRLLFTQLLLLMMFFSCSAQHEKEHEKVVEDSFDTVEYELEEVLDETVVTVKIPLDRTEILERLKQKVNNEEPLIVHLFVPLCDNENQGIVPTSPSLGNGMDLRRNLYWATSQGIKRFYKELSDWELLTSINKPDSNVLERVVFQKIFPNNANVILVADAYRGDRMQACLSDYFESLSGNLKEQVMLDSIIYEIHSEADLIIFNGHNGLMDEEVDFSYNTKSVSKDAVAIACISEDYFREYWENTSSYPLVMTTGLMYPGAFVSEFIINEWAMLKSAEEIRKAAGKSYYKYKPKSGPNGSNNLFSTGWLDEE